MVGLLKELKGLDVNNREAGRKDLLPARFLG
jgi:hypothetical protein